MRRPAHLAAERVHDGADAFAPRHRRWGFHPLAARLAPPIRSAVRPTLPHPRYLRRAIAGAIQCIYILAMEERRFEWGPRKASQNAKKHGVTFDEAASTFSDERALVIPDPDHSVAEEHFILLGLSMKLRVVVVCHCLRERAGTIRIISARKATKSERQEYFDHP